MDFPTIASLPWDLILEVLGFSVGLLYLWWEYHADARLWLASIVMPTISMWIYFRKGIYADFAINIYYFLMAIYGYLAWTRSTRRNTDEAHREKNTPELHITHLRGRKLLATAGIAAALWAGIYCVLRFLTDSTVPLADALTTALSIVGTWMLSRKHIEQWLVWIVVDIVCVCLYIYKGIYFYATLYAIYTVIAGFGYRKWRRMMREQTA